MEERGFKEIVSPFKEKIERRGWVQAFGAGEKSLGEGVLCQSRLEKKPNVLFQGEMGPFWGKGHLPTIWI